MSVEKTLLIVKPDAVAARHTGEIIARLEREGFTVTGLVMRRLDREAAADFYSIHRGKDFFGGLVDFMTSGPLVAARLEAPGARARLRELAGATEPSRAAPGTIRADFGTTTRMNAIHASNPEEDVVREVRFFFPEG